MIPRVSPQVPGFDTTYQASSGAALPAPPPRDAFGASQGGRRAARPLSLITALPSTQVHLHEQTPLTTTSLSSPFVVNNSTIRAVSAGGSGTASRGVSPASNRMSGQYNVQYDPRNWTSATPDAYDPQSHAALEDGTASPPPPYTVPANNASNVRSSNAQTSDWRGTPPPPRDSTPVNHGVVDSDSHVPRYNPASMQQGRQTYDPRRHTNMHNSMSIDATGQVRSLTSNRASQSVTAQSDLNTASHSYRPGLPRLGSSNEGTPNLPTPPNARYSTPEGALGLERPPRAEGDMAIAKPNTSSRRKWTPGMPLPGPPPGLPPSSARSESTGSIPERAFERPINRPQSSQLPLRNHDAAPSSWEQSSGSSSRRPRSGPPISLRIDTGVAPKSQTPARPVLPREPAVDRPANNANLGRKPAIRDTSSRILKERQNRSLSRGSAKESAISLSNNPWAEALEKSKTPIEQPLSLERLTLNRNVSDDSDRKFGRSHTPPPTPYGGGKAAEQSSADVSRAKVLPTPPLSQKPLLSANSALQSASSMGEANTSNDDFVSESLQRCTDFLEQERSAKTDLERLQLFASFIQEESVIRKERYWSAYESADFDPASVKEGLFSGVSRRRASMRGSQIFADAVVSPGPSSASSVQQQQQQRPETMWWKDYRPQLSPIASMGYDEMSSRGRAPSRWFESHTGSRSDEAEYKAQRSKRESKYMSLSKSLLKSMEEEDLEMLPETMPHRDDFDPDEKGDPSRFGFYDEQPVSAPLTGRGKKLASPSLLDISRFVTLPPPYPRHYPAVNNSHPDLADYRNTVRALSELNEIKERQQRHQDSIEALRNKQQARIVESRRTFKSEIQRQLDAGAISYKEAGEAEQSFQDEEHAAEKRTLQSEFDMLQDVVINPLHELLNDRLTKLEASLQLLEESLLENAQNQDPDLPVQEGDDIPELLEQLTQYKWLFEARENIHAELFKILSQRNNAYKTIVALPYKQSNNENKVRDTEAFFANDAAGRHLVFCKESHERHRAFLEVLNEHAQRGIQMQSSAFWDIAPGLLDLLDKVPEDVDSIEIHIPDEEYEENPTYHDYPQQYLYSLLSHASKSTYQYMEAQTNLLCLVHEVKTSELAARHQVNQVEASLGRGKLADADNIRSKEEHILTEELKTRASLIEEQWRDAVGDKFDATQANVRDFLEQRGALADLDEDGTGPAIPEDRA